MKNKTITIYKDNFSNTAIIEQLNKIKAFCDDKQPKKAYRLICSADYENNLIYHISIHETFEQAQDTLNEFSCGTFKKIGD